jgi:hypothetical protein
MENIERDNPLYNFTRGNGFISDEQIYNYSLSANGRILILEIFEYSGYRACLLTRE